MDNITLRKARPSDCEFAFRAKEAAFKEYVEKAGGWSSNVQQQLHERRFGTQDFRVIDSGGIDVGIVAIVVESDCVKVNQLFLLPEYQGRGIGCECMRLIIEEARQLGLAVQLRVLKVNPRALAFYERMGFTRIGDTVTHHLMERDKNVEWT